MKILVSFALILISTLSYAETNNCCFCVTDPADPSTNKECARWIKENRKSCGYSKMLLSSKNQLEKTISCDKVRIQLTQHGLSNSYHEAIDIMAQVAEEYRPKEVVLDGTTCLIFNNLNDVEKQVEFLSLTFPQVYFDISGNQNIGVVFTIPLIYRPKEVTSMASKVNFKADNGKVDKNFAACTRPNKTCAFISVDYFANNNPNEKFCLDNNEVTTQECCPKDKNSKEYTQMGKWSLPGNSCNG